MAHPPDARAASGKGAPDAGEAELLRRQDVLCLRAANPGPLTLSGTNTWVVGREPAWVVDPGPLLDKHLMDMFAAVDARGGLGGVALTHDHHDHSEAAQALLERYQAPLAAAREPADIPLAEGARVGPFEALATPGHSADHFAFALVAGTACFTGDAVLGEGSVFISPDPGAMSGYLLALQRLQLREEITVLCPGHGPAVWDAHAKLAEYLDHRIDRENRLITALGEGRRSVGALLDSVWADVPGPLRPAATATLAAHLDKLEEEQALPAGVERPDFGQADFGRADW